MTFFNDLFNESSNTTLASHVPDLGGTWVKHPNFTGNATVNAANDWAIGDNTTSALYYNNVSPPSADYSVSATIQINTNTTPNTGVMGRISSSASTMYMFYTSGSSWVLAKLVGGTNTDLLNVTFSPALNTDYTIELSMVGNTISARVNGSHIAGSPVTDSSITSAGFPGLRLRSGGSLKDITAVNLGTGTTITCNLATASATGYTASILAATTIACAIGTAAAVGYQSTVQVGSATTINCALGQASALGYQATVAVSGSGTLVTEPLKNNTGTLLASQTGATAFVYNVSTGALVVAKTGQTTNASGVMTITDALITPATQYRVVVVLSGGAEGMAKYTAS